MKRERERDRDSLSLFPFTYPSGEFARVNHEVALAEFHLILAECTHLATDRPCETRFTGCDRATGDSAAVRKKKGDNAAACDVAIFYEGARRVT